MDAIRMIKERRSVRKYKNEKVDREIMKEIIEISRWAPSWANFQIVRYTLVDDAATIATLATDGAKGFVQNIETLTGAKGVAVLSIVKGISGKLDPGNNKYATAKTMDWEEFDAGIACQTFCLAAHAKGVATCILGVIDDTSIAEIVDLPKDEMVSALIVYGYGDELPPVPPRNDVGEIVRFV